MCMLRQKKGIKFEFIICEFKSPYLLQLREKEEGERARTGRGRSWKIAKDSVHLLSLLFCVRIFAAAAAPLLDLYDNIMMARD
jgi:hypothetical protein